MSNRCPSCGFGGAAILTDGSRQCASCGNVYSLPVAYPSVPGHRADGKGDDNDVRFAIKFFVGLAVLLTIGGFVASFFLYGDGGVYDEDGDFSKPTPAQSSPPATVPAATAPVAHTLAAEVEFTGASGVNGAYSWWLVTYRNIGSQSISHPKVHLSITDNDDKELASQTGIAYVWELPPDEEVVVLVQLKDAPEGWPIFTAHELASNGFYADRMRKVTVSEFNITERSGALSRFAYLDGKLRNNNPKTATMVRVLATGKDADGNIVGFAHGSPKDSTIRVYAYADFRLTTGTWQTEKPETWEIDAWCVLAK